ncbi:probable serine/threonine-protein kinase WNK10 [Spinacia oleracea]|uniref:non-specific serine/threonine protein kinase n=1 Tax=Spinacia oleracea TaxID=3562 RepID=A0A9R0IDA2_SPIOL|nr:probable serine/threonine-protein kinase WNK10 [Spinacia oleracea]
MASCPEVGYVSRYDVVERESTGRYARYDMIIAQSGIKTVYKGFDGVNGLEIAWTKTVLTKELLKNEEYVKSLCQEANILKSLKHESIVKCYDSWVDFENKIIHMITEPFFSGNLVRYLNKHTFQGNTIIKNWCRQILNGLVFLHTHNPPIIHRDIKCENIFVNGKTGSVKLGDFSSAMILDDKLMIPPEVSEKVDIYDFGLCIIQMFTKEPPYSNKQYARAKAKLGVMPADLNKVTDPVAKLFIERCLAPESERPSAIILLDHPFLAQTVPTTLRARRLNLRTCLRTVSNQVDRLQPKTFKLTGEIDNNGSISMSLLITFRSAKEETIQIHFSLKNDTIQEVVARIATQNGWSTAEATLVSELMENRITALKSSDSRWSCF